MTSVLLVIDAQRNMLLPPEPVPAAAGVGAAVEHAIATARAAGAQIVHIRNNGGAGDPDEPGTPGWQLVHEPAPGEHVVDKPDSDAFAGTDLAERVPPGARLVLVGMQSEYCVRATALGGIARRHPVTLVRGAHATYPGGTGSAAEVSAGVETELAGAGVLLVEPVDLTFD